jgi:hypothetical protein
VRQGHARSHWPHDVLENVKEAKEAERWLLSKDFDALGQTIRRSC